MGTVEIDPTRPADRPASLWSGGSLFDLNALVDPLTNFEMTRANGVNDSGQIVGSGWFYDENGVRSSRSVPANPHWRSSPGSIGYTLRFSEAGSAPRTRTRPRTLHTRPVRNRSHVSDRLPQTQTAGCVVTTPCLHPDLFRHRRQQLTRTP